MSQQKKKEWWEKNKGFTVQSTFSQVEYEILAIVQMITERTFTIADLRGTRIVKRIGEGLYKGNFQLWCLNHDDFFDKIEFILHYNCDEDPRCTDVVIKYDKRREYDGSGSSWQPWDTTVRYFKKDSQDEDGTFCEVPFLRLATE